MARAPNSTKENPDDIAMVGAPDGDDQVAIREDGDDEGDDRELEVELEDEEDKGEGRAKTKQARTNDPYAGDDDDEEDEGTGTVDDGYGESARGSHRQRRNRARREAVHERDQTIAELRKQLEETNAKIARLGIGQIGTARMQVEGQLRDASSAFQLADQELRAAGEANDGTRIVAAMKLRDEAATRVNQLRHHREQLLQHESRATEAARGGDGEGRQTREREAFDDRDAPDPRAVEFGEIFRERFPNFDPRGNDETSAIIRAIDDTVAREGFVPSTPQYWRELEKRLASRGITAEGEDEGTRRDDGRERRQAALQRRGAAVPPTGRVRSTNVPGRSSFTLSREQYEILEGEGLTGKLNKADLEKRNRIINRWREGQKSLHR